jgi:peptidoglycan-associated lipoprotein
MRDVFFGFAVICCLVGCQSQPPAFQEKVEVVPPAPLVQHIIYYDFDKDIASYEVTEILMPHVRYLIQNPTKKVLVEGAADETGPADYNIQLGLRRAKKIESMLLAGGIAKEQIIVRSIGLQRPLNSEKKPYSLARNRRVTLVY